jgi:virulence-associated protein VagC
MQTVELVETDTGQIVPLPAEFRFDTPRVSIRRQGDALVLEPVRPSQWPAHFFEDIRIEDAAFVRPDQGLTPHVPSSE